MTVLLMGLGLLAFPSPGAGQSWAADVHSGRSSWPTVPLNAPVDQAMVGLRYASPWRTFQAGVSAPLKSGDLGWGMTALTQRISKRSGRFEWGVDGAGLIHAQRDPGVDGLGWGARGDLLPFLGSSLGPLVAEARSGLSVYRGSLGGTVWGRTLHPSELRISLPLSSSAVLASEVRHLRKSDEAYTGLGASLSVVRGRGGAWASIGQWVDGVPSGETSGSWGLGASLALASSTTVWASVRRDAFDPFYLSAGRSSWGIGLSHRLGSTRSLPAGPGVYPTPRERGRMTSGTLIRIPIGSAGRPPSVAGDFSAWTPIPMKRNGIWWEADLELSPGLHHLAFQRVDGSWFVPEAMPNRRPDGMGGWVAVVVIPDEER
jgi:hypothetical protein